MAGALGHLLETEGRPSANLLVIALAFRNRSGLPGCQPPAVDCQADVTVQAGSLRPAVLGWGSVWVGHFLPLECAIPRRRFDTSPAPFPHRDRTAESWCGKSCDTLPPGRPS